MKERSERQGYTKSWRKELDSDIWQMPPLYYKVWAFLRQTVSWEKNVFPTRNGYGIHLNPGQNLYSLQTIIDGVAWKERNVIKRPNKKTILCILRWLAIQGMICRESNGCGTFITICNWEKYQGCKKEKVTEGTPEGTPQRTPEGTPEGGHTKEVVKKLKEVKEVTTRGSQKRFVPPTVAEVKAYCLERGNTINPQEFVDHYATTNWFRGKTKIKDWKACVRTWEGRQKAKTGKSQKTFKQMKDERTNQAINEFIGG